MSNKAPGQRVPDPVERPTLTVTEAAVILQISRSTLYDALRTGDVPSIRIGRRLLVPTARLRDLLGLDAATRVAPSDQLTIGSPLP